MRRTRYTYQSLGGIFLAFLTSIFLDHEFGRGWYFLTVVFGAHCVRGSAYTASAGQKPPNGPLSWIGLIIHKVLYPLSLPLEKFQIGVATKLVRLMGSRGAEFSIWRGMAPEVEGELSHLATRLEREGRPTEVEVARADEGRRELRKLGVPEEKIERINQFAQRLDESLPDPSKMARLWPFASAIFSFAIPFIILMMKLSHKLARNQYDSTDISHADHLPTPMFIEDYREEGGIPTSFDNFEAAPSTYTGWNPALSKLESAALYHLIDGQYDRVLGASMAADRVLKQLSDQVLSGAPAAPRETYLRNLEFWVGAKLLAIRHGGRPSLLQLRKIYESLVAFKAIEVDILGVRHRVVQAAPEKSHKLLRRTKPSLGERLKVESRAAAKNDEKRLHLRLREAGADLFLSGAIYAGLISSEVEGVSWDKIDGGIPQGALFLDFYRYKPIDVDFLREEEIGLYDRDRYCLFAIRDGKILNRDLGDASEIDDLVLNHLWHLSGQQYSSLGRKIAVPRGQRPEATGGAWLSSGKALADKILKPLGEISQDFSRLFVSCDGYLSRIPFETLSLDGNEPLIEKCTISYVDSARDFGRAALNGEQRTGPPLVVGAPNYDLGSKATDEGFAALEGTQTEAHAIAELVGVTAMVGDKALKRSVMSSRRPSILHLATHGYYVPPASAEQMERDVRPSTVLGRWDALGRIPNPLMRSGLALSGANTWLRGKRPPAAAGNGLLTADDVLEMDLAGTQLVVLSACETGLGEPRPGEGVFGLRRTFFIAGARCVVSTLWSVPDEATSIFMTCFYEQLLKGSGKADALRSVQLTLRRKFPHPSGWAAFVCVGDTAPVRFLNRQPA